jgi:hypothetical protein
VSVLSIAVAFAASDVAMAAVAGGARYFVPTTVGQWLTSATVDAMGGYLLFGLPQLRAWARPGRKPVGANDLRTRVSIRLLEGRHWLSFILASLIGGPLAVGLASGYSGHPNGRRRTFASAWILGAFWAAIYLGLASLVLG